MTASKIEWTDRSDWNPIRGCTRVSPGCGGPGEHGGCYAEAMAARFSLPGMWGHGYAEMANGKPRWTGKVELQADRLTLPLSWKKPAKVFASSTSDFFHEQMTDDDIDKLFAVMALTPHLTYQVLTKRPERMRDYMLERWQPAKALKVDMGGGDILNMPAEIEGADRRDQIAEMIQILVDDDGELKRRFCDTENDAHWTAEGELRCLQFTWPLPNVWLGVSAERQQEADERIPLLLQTPAAIRFVSCEPLLGPINLASFWRPDFREWWNALTGEITNDRHRGDVSQGYKLDWVIAGGESGLRARPMHPDWARSLRDQCDAAGVPFFFKQWGEWEKALDRDVEDPDWRADYRVRFNDRGNCRWLNLDGGRGFHGERFHVMRRAGKAHTGALLDGREHKAFPEVRAC